MDFLCANLLGGQQTLNGTALDVEAWNGGTCVSVHVSLPMLGQKLTWKVEKLRDMLLVAAA